MCLEHDHTISRRRLGSLVAGAAGLSLLPFAARAADVGTLCITCIDFRFVAKDVTWLNGALNYSAYDIVALAGASLAAFQTKVPQKPDAFWNQVAIAKSLHHIKKVVLVDHMDCGAYKVAYGTGDPPELPPEDEKNWHKSILKFAAGKIRADQGLAVDCYLMPFEGPPEKFDF